MTQHDDISMRLDEDVDYLALDDETLFDLAARPGDQFIATSALAELSRRNAPGTRAAALAILTGTWADRHLRAFAIPTLYEVDRRGALDIMTALLDDTTDPKLLDAMVECVLANEDHFHAADQHAFTSKLARRVASEPPDTTTDIDDRQAFIAAFGTTQTAP